MAAISTTLFAFLRAGDTVLHSRPLYGGTETLLQKQMGSFGITAFGFADGINTIEMRKTAEAARVKGRVGLILVETPANPTNGLVDLAACATIADELARTQGHRPPVVVDNTMLGPMFQTPLKCGADILLCSLTKYVGGHSDLVGGSISGDGSLVKQVMSWRSSSGTQLDPNSCWMLMRSLETLEIRMTRSNANARIVAAAIEAARAGDHGRGFAFNARRWVWSETRLTVCVISPMSLARRSSSAMISIVAACRCALRSIARAEAVIRAAVSPSRISTFSVRRRNASVSPRAVRRPSDTRLIAASCSCDAPAASSAPAPICSIDLRNCSAAAEASVSPLANSSVAAATRSNRSAGVEAPHLFDQRGWLGARH
jgi:hypothetical protein